MKLEKIHMILSMKRRALEQDIARIDQQIALLDHRQSAAKASYIEGWKTLRQSEPSGLKGHDFQLCTQWTEVQMEKNEVLNEKKTALVHQSMRVRMNLKAICVKQDVIENLIENYRLKILQKHQDAESSQRLETWISASRLNG